MNNSWPHYATSITYLSTSSFTSRNFPSMAPKKNLFLSAHSFQASPCRSPWNSSRKGPGVGGWRGGSWNARRRWRRPGARRRCRRKWSNASCFLGVWASWVMVFSVEWCEVMWSDVEWCWLSRNLSRVWVYSWRFLLCCGRLLTGVVNWLRWRAHSRRTKNMQLPNVWLR